MFSCGEFSCGFGAWEVLGGGLEGPLFTQGIIEGGIRLNVCHLVIYFPACIVMVLVSLIRLHALVELEELLLVSFDGWRFSTATGLVPKYSAIASENIVLNIT